MELGDDTEHAQLSTHSQRTEREEDGSSLNSSNRLSHVEFIRDHLYQLLKNSVKFHCPVVAEKAKQL